jgi:Fe2+ transport system protein FeoA
MIRKDLTQMQAGEVGHVAKLHGGHGFTRRLGALGIHPGMKITKVSSQIMRGPVIVRVGATTIGYGMARHVLVDI